MRRVLFLDIDGVLNSTEFLKARAGEVLIADFSTNPERRIDPACVSKLNRIIDGLDVEVILSSSWRHVFTLGQMQAFLRARRFNGRLLGETPKLSAIERHKEIRRWLREQPNVPRFVILDDDISAGYGFGHRFIKIIDGLTDEDADKARSVIE